MPGFERPAACLISPLVLVARRSVAHATPGDILSFPELPKNARRVALSSYDRFLTCRFARAGLSTCRNYSSAGVSPGRTTWFGWHAFRSGIRENSDSLLRLIGILTNSATQGRQIDQTMSCALFSRRPFATHRRSGICADAHIFKRLSCVRESSELAASD